MLRRLEADRAEPTDETRLITCLEQWNDWRYACVGSDLFELTADGIGKSVFRLDGFHATIQPCCRSRGELRAAVGALQRGRDALGVDVRRLAAHRCRRGCERDGPANGGRGRRRRGAQRSGG